MSLMNQQVLFLKHPIGAPKLDDFDLVEKPVPDLQDGEVLVKTLYFSLDPYMRGRMSDAKSYAQGFPLGEVMGGGAVCVVEESKNPTLKVGEVVMTFTGWQTYAVLKNAEIPMLQKLPKDIQPSLFLGALGMPGFTAYYGLLHIGEPKAGETVVVAAATGPVGSMVGQLAKARGCHVVGIAGGQEKCRFATHELGFDGCVDHKSDSFEEDLKKACPKGIDVYFENVGGHVFKAIFPLLNNFARVPICGMIASYNATSQADDPSYNLGSAILRVILVKRMRFQGFIISEHYDHYNTFLAEVVPLVQSGKIKFKEDVVKGIENSPQAFIGLLEGKNFGKLLIEI
jgi:NADPH-dependent curcumin reductase CurA